MADFRRRARSFPPRQTSLDWVRLISVARIPVAAGAKVLLGGFSAGVDVTIRRVLGQFWVEGDDTALQDTQIGVLGGMVVSDIAFAAGAASVPGPVTELSNDYWSLWQPFLQVNELVAAGGIGRNSMPREFDTKAQRKLPHGSVYALIVENASATDGMTIMFAASTLMSH